MRLTLLICLVLSALSAVACDGAERARVLCQVGYCPGGRV